MSTTTKVIAVIAFALVAVFATTQGVSAYASGELVPFNVTCATTATRIAPSAGGGFSGASCYSVSATSVFVGGASVAASNAYCISTTAGSCGSNIINVDMDANAGFCRVASGTVDIFCLGAK